MGTVDLGEYYKLKLAKLTDLRIRKQPFVLDHQREPGSRDFLRYPNKMRGYW